MKGIRKMHMEKKRSNASESTFQHGIALVKDFWWRNFKG